MALIAPFAAVTGRASSAVRSAGQTVVAYVLIGLLGLVGTAFLLAALFIWLAAATDPLAASLILGTAMLAIAGITLAVISAGASRRKRERRRSSTDAAMMASTLSLATTGLKLASRVRGPLLIPALAAIAAGWYLSRSGGDHD